MDIDGLLVSAYFFLCNYKSFSAHRVNSNDVMDEGPVAIISPFNFPLEIPVLQLMGSLFMGNKPVLKPAEKCSIVMEQFIRLLHAVGAPIDDIDFLNSEGLVAEALVTNDCVKLTQFTGSSRVAEILAVKTRGKVKIEDAGKICLY